MDYYYIFFFKIFSSFFLRTWYSLLLLVLQLCLKCILSLLLDNFFYYTAKISWRWRILFFVQSVVSSCHAIITLFFKLYSANQFFVTHHHHLRIAYFFMFNRSPKMSLLIIITKWFLLADKYSFEVFFDDKIYYKVAFQQFFPYCWGFPLWLWQIHSFKHLTPDFFLRLPSPFPCIMHTEKHRAR